MVEPSSPVALERLQSLGNLEEQLLQAQKQARDETEAEESADDELADDEAEEEDEAEDAGIEEKFLAQQNLARAEQASVQKSEASALTGQNAATSILLDGAWKTVFEDFTLLSLLYINLHVFGHLLLGDKYFCKLGHESQIYQVDGVAATGGGATEPYKNIIETCALIFLDFLVLAIILIALVMIILLVKVVNNPLGFTVNAILGINWN